MPHFFPLEKSTSQSLSPLGSVFRNVGKIFLRNSVILRRNRRVFAFLAWRDFWESRTAPIRTGDKKHGTIAAVFFVTRALPHGGDHGGGQS